MMRTMIATLTVALHISLSPCVEQRNLYLLTYLQDISNVHTIWMPDLRNELHLGRLERILGREDEVGLEEATLAEKRVYDMVVNDRSRDCIGWKRKGKTAIIDAELQGREEKINKDKSNKAKHTRSPKETGENRLASYILKCVGRANNHDLPSVDVIVIDQTSREAVDWIFIQL